MTVSLQQTMMDNFKKFDTNHDNFIEKDEIEAMAKKNPEGEDTNSVLAARIMQSDSGIFNIADNAQYGATPDGKIGYGDLQAIDNRDIHGGVNVLASGQQSENDGILSTIMGKAKQSMLLNSLMDMMNKSFKNLTSIFPKN